MPCLASLTTLAKEPFMCGLLENAGFGTLDHKYGRNLGFSHKYVRSPMKISHFLPLSCHEWHVMGPKKMLLGGRDDLVKVL